MLYGGYPKILLSAQEESALNEFVEILQKFQRLNLEGAELKSLQDGFRDNYDFLQPLDSIVLKEKDEPTTFVNSLITRAGIRSRR